MQRKLAAILHADVVGYSRLMEGNETVTLRRLKSLRKQLWEPAIAQHNGRLVGTAGDALLIEFASVVGAVRCAIDLQKGMAERNTEEPDHRKMLLRIGVNLGEVIIDEDNDLFGDGVNIAARLQALAEPGGVLVSGKVHDEVMGRIGHEFIDCGEQQVKNINRPVRAYRLVLGELPVPPPVPEATKPTPVKPLPLPEPPSTQERSTAPGGAGPGVMAPITRTRATIKRRVENSWTFAGKDRDGVAFELVISASELKHAAEGLVLGRHSEQCDLVVAHGSLSRRHARLRIGEGRLTIEDLGSTNGTIVDGMRLPVETPRPLRDGAQLLLGEIRFVVTETGGDHTSS
ncbi:MAG: cya [Alphaproteobacteria bacterium]|jgi:class 3 adenylate cyclase|nr:cya [Alphaproteobacteria bacterium]